MKTLSGSTGFGPMPSAGSDSNCSRKKDAATAMDILSQEIPDAFPFEEIGQEYLQPRCPRCNSLDVKFEEYSGITLLLLYVFSLPVPIHRNYWKCEECGQKWQETD
jgi:transposase-like protein